MPICQWQERNWHIIKLADWHIITGGLAQLARASALHAEGQRFESVILHIRWNKLSIINCQLSIEKDL